MPCGLPACGSRSAARGWFGVGAGFYAELYSNVPGMDYIDRHHYYGGGPGGWQILPGQPFNHEVALTEPEHILKLSLERVLGMPYGISEWANVLPNQWRLEAPPLMTFYGKCLNGWDAPMHFALEGTAGGFTRLLKWMWPVSEPSTLCQYPALSQVIRRGDVREGEPVFARNLSEQKTFGARPLKDVAIKVDISGPYEMSAEQGVNARSLASYYAAAVGKTGVRFTGSDEARLLHRLEPLPRHAEEGDPLDDRRTVLELRLRLRDCRHSADSGCGRIPGRRAGAAERLRDPHVQPLRVDSGHVVGRPAVEPEPAHPDHGGRPLPEHRYGLQPRWAAVAGHRDISGTVGGRPWLGDFRPGRQVRRRRVIAVRLPDVRRVAEHRGRQDRHPARRAESGGLLRRAVSVSMIR